MTFTGFTAEASEFFIELAKNNDREFFASHRDVYERAIRQPLEDLLGEAEPLYGPGRIMRQIRASRVKVTPLNARVKEHLGTALSWP